MLVVISGLPGVGKAAVAAAVAAGLGAVHLSIDLIEESLLQAGLPRAWGTGVAAYEAVRAAAEQNLALGRTVVVDAVNDSEAARDTWRTGSARTHLDLVFILLTLNDPDEHRRRLERRTRNLVNIAEPTWDQVQARAAAFSPWDETCVRVSAAGPVEQVAQTIMNLLPDSKRA